MGKKVIHLLRKQEQLQASFINNQIYNHINYKAVIAFRKGHKESFSKDSVGNHVYNIGSRELLFEKLTLKFFLRIGRGPLKRLRQILEIEKPSVLHFHYGSDASIFMTGLKNFRIPKIVSFYGYDCFSFPRRWGGVAKKILQWAVFKRATKILVMSPEMEKDLHNLGCPLNKIIVHYHGVPATLSKVVRNYKLKDRVNLMMLSYLDPVKGHIFVFKAIKKLLEEGLNGFILHVYGDGNYRDYLEGFVSENKLCEVIKFMGPVEYNSDFYVNAFTDADIFLHPSVTTKHDKEGIPGALVEAMFAGLPVISTYHGGIPYVIQHDVNGLLVQEWDEKALKEAIISLLNSFTLRKRLGVAALQYASDNLDLQAKEAELEQIYDSLL